MQMRRAQCLIRRSSVAAWLLLASSMLIARETTPSTLAPASTPAHQIFDLSIFVVTITGGIFLVVGGILAVALYRFREHKTDADAERAQIYGSTQIELAWTVIPILIVVVLFLATACIIFAIQDAPEPKTALHVTVIDISSGGSSGIRNTVLSPRTNSTFQSVPILHPKQPS